MMCYKMSFLVFFLPVLVMGDFHSDSRGPCNHNILLNSNHEVWTTDENNNMQLKYEINNHEIKLSKLGSVCLDIKRMNTSLDISLNSVKSNCISKKFMYAVPIFPEITCTAISDGSILSTTNYDDCKTYTEKSLRDKFQHYETMNIVASSCENKYRFLHSRSIWWAAELDFQRIEKYYKVYKCLEEQRIISLDVTYKLPTGSYIIKQIEVKENEPFTFTFNNITITINDINLSNNIFYNFGKIFYVTNPYDDFEGFLDSANTESTFIGGMFGEIRCNLHPHSNFLIDIKSCKVTKNLITVSVDGYEINTCKLDHLNYGHVLKQSNIFSPSDHINIINYKNTGIIEYTNPSFIFNIKSTMSFSEFQTPDTCQVISNDIISMEPVLYNKTSNFTIKVSNIKPTIVSFRCDERILNLPSINYNQENKFDILTVKFYPVLTYINTTCRVYCGFREVSIFKIQGKFINTDENLNMFSLIKSDEGLINDTDITKNMFSELYDAASEWVKSTWNKIIAGISSLIIIVLVILGILICLGRFPYSWCCCCCRSKKQQTDDEETALNNIKVIKNKFKKSNNVDSIEMSEMNSLIEQFYAFNGERIEIINEDYSIKDDGIYYKSTLIVHSIPRVIFYKDTFKFKNNKIFLNNQIVVDNVKGNKHLNSNYILERGVIYNLDDFSKPLMMLRSHNLSDMQILDSDYTRIGNDLYYEEHEIIKNIFLDIDDE